MVIPRKNQSFSSRKNFLTVNNGPGRNGITRSEAKSFFTSPNLNLLKRTGVEGAYRGKLEKDLFGPEGGRFGSMIQKEEITKLKREIEHKQQTLKSQGKYSEAGKLGGHVSALDELQKKFFNKK